MKQQIRYFAAIGIVAFVLVTASPVATEAVRAESNEDGVSTTGLESDQESLKKQQELLREAQKQAKREQTEAESARDKAEAAKVAEQRDSQNEKAAKNKQKACKNREKAIKKIITRTTTNGQHYYDVVTHVYDNAKNYAEKKSVELTQVSDQIANIESAQTLAQAAITETVTAGEEFSCDSGTPKSAASVFLAAKKKQTAALKVYRDAVKQLLAAVKAAVELKEGDTDTTNETGSSSTTENETDNTAGGTE